MSIRCETVQLLQASLYTDYSAADKVKHSNRDLHTDAFFRLFEKILAFLASLFAASMRVTRFAIWWVRSKKKKPLFEKATSPVTAELQPVMA